MPAVECYTSPKQLPSHMGYWKAKVLTGPLLPPFLFWPCRSPGSLQSSQHPAPKQSLVWNDLPQRLGRWREEERRGHCVLVSQCEWCGWHSAQSLESSCPLLYKYVHKATCAPAQDQSKVKILSRLKTASQQTWGEKEGSVSCHSLL